MDFDLSPLWISLKIATVSTAFTFILGLLFAKYAYQKKRYRFLINGILSLPMVLPPTVMGFFLLILFGKNSALGSILETIGIHVIFTWPGAVIASIIVSFPIMYLTTLGAFEQVDPELIDAARTLGFSEWAIFFKIWIPLSWPGIAAGTILSFARALGEFGATIMVAGNLPGKTRTMSIAVYTAMQGGNRELAYKWVGIIMAISLCILILMNYWSSRQYSKQK